MNELFLEKPGELKMRDKVAEPSLKDNEARIKVIYGGICGSDLRVFRGSLPYANYPCCPGHEILGTIVEAGKDSPFTVGTKVVSFPNTFCDECEFCAQGRTNICKNKKSFGVTVNGLFGQEVIIDTNFVIPVPDDLPDERAILIEPFSVNVHALKKAAIAKGTTMAVIGCGTEGLLSIALANYLGADLTVLDLNKTKLEMAQCFNKNIKVMHPADITDETFDIVVEAAGVKASFEQAMNIVKPGGSLIAMGLTGDSIDFPAMRIVRSEITIYGSIIYTKKDFEDAIKLLQDPAFNISPVLSKIVPYTQYEQAYTDALSGNFAKIVLNFKED